MSKIKNTTPRITSLMKGAQLNAIRDRIGPAALVLAAQMISFVVVVVAYYIIVFFAAVRVVPLTMGFVLEGSGVRMDMAFETIVAVWIAPSLFLIGMVFVLALVLMKKIWRLRRLVLNRVQLRMLGKAETDTADTGSRFPNKRRLRDNDKKLS